MTEIRHPSTRPAEHIGSPGRGALLFAAGTPYRWQGRPGWDPEALGQMEGPRGFRAERTPEFKAARAEARRARTPEQKAADAAKRREMRAAIDPETRAAKRREADRRYKAKIRREAA